MASGGAVDVGVDDVSAGDGGAGVAPRTEKEPAPFDYSSVVGQGLVPSLVRAEACIRACECLPDWQHAVVADAEHTRTGSCALWAILTHADGKRPHSDAVEGV